MGNVNKRVKQTYHTYGVGVCRDFHFYRYYMPIAFKRYFMPPAFNLDRVFWVFSASASYSR